MDVSALLQTLADSMQHLVQDISDVDIVIGATTNRDLREASNSNSSEELVEAALATMTMEPRSGQAISNYLRSLEAIDACCQMLSRDDMPTMLALLRRDSDMSKFLHNYSLSWSHLLRALGTSKSKASDAAGDAQQILINAFERTIRATKGLVSILEGGSTSKSD
jgi:hypothetical protein